MDYERCNAECELCPANFPWNEQFWICAEGGSTYIFEYDRVNQEVGKLKTKVTHATT